MIFMNVLNVIFAMALPIVFTGLFVMSMEKTGFQQVPAWLRELIIGIVFGLCSGVATYLGVKMGGMYFSVRDAAPLAVGLIFGSPASLIAGLIGALARWLITLTGNGLYSVVACSLACLMAGFLGAAARTFMFHGKTPSWGMGIALAFVCETFHMLLILATHMDDITEALNFVNACLLPMVLGTSCSVGGSLYLAAWLKQMNEHSRPVRSMNMTIRVWLSLCTCAAFIITAVSIYFINSTLILNDVSSSLRRGLQTAQAEISLELVHRKNNPTLPDNLMVSSTGPVLILDQNHEIIADPNGHEGLVPHVEELLSQPPWTMQSLEYQHRTWLVMYSEFEGYYIIAAMPEQEIVEVRNSSLYLILLAIFLVFAALFCLIYYLMQRIIYKTLDSISLTLDEIPNVPNPRENDQRSRQFQFTSLSEDINQAVDSLRNYVEEAEKRKKRQAMQAIELHDAFLPSTEMPVYPEVEEFDLYALSLSCVQAGGDFYDYFMTGPHHIALMIGDASGWGIDSGLLALKTKTMLHDRLAQGASLSYAFRTVNDALCEHNPNQEFISVWAGILDLKTGKLEYINAGNTRPYFCLDDERVLPQIPPGLQLGRAAGTRFSIRTICMHPGDRIFLCSDGLTQAINARKESYGYERLGRILHLWKYENCKLIVSKVMADLKEFIGSTPLRDDVTMLEFELRSLRQKDTIWLPATKLSIERAIQFAEAKCSEFHLSEKMVKQVLMVVESFYTACVNYSGGLHIELKMEKLPDESVLVTVKDDGTFEVTEEMQKDFLHNGLSGGFFESISLVVIRNFSDVKYVHESGEHSTIVRIYPEGKKPADGPQNPV